VTAGLLGLTGTSSDLWEQEINTEWCVLVVQKRLQLGDLLAEHVWGVANSSDNTETTSVGDSSSELWAGSNIHASKEDWVVDLEEVGGDRAELLC